MPRQGGTTIDRAEVEQFSRLAAQWWDERGPMAMLHKFNPVRLSYIRDQVSAHFGRNPRQIGCLSGLRILDIGCGGGILSEPLARLGAQVVGADPSEANVEVARRHAALTDLVIDYRAVTAEALADRNEKFDVVLAMEVVEHTGFPAILRPSFTLGGTGGGIAYNLEEFGALVRRALELSPRLPLARQVNRSWIPERNR